MTKPGWPLHRAARCVLLVCSLLTGHAPLAATQAPAAAGSAVCGTDGIGAGKHLVPVISGGRTRQVMIFVPTLAKGGRALPLIFDLHGGGSNGTEQSQFTHFADLASKEGFVVANPNGGGTLQYVAQAHNWTIPGAPAGGAGDSRNAPDDVQFISDAIDQIAAKTCVDLRRVYVDGMSAGARMSSFVGCRLSARVAAIGAVAGLKAGLPSADDPAVPDPATCQPQRPMPIIGFHGTGDATNPYYGGSANGGYGIPAALQRWSELDHCEGQPREQKVASNVVLVTYKQCAGGAEIWMYRTEAPAEKGGGHVWPGAPMPNGASEINASELMWQFFKRFSLPAEVPG